MKSSLFIVLFFIAYSSTAIADEIGKLSDMARASEDHRELTIDCLIEMKIGKSKGWKSEECTKYKLFSTSELQVFKSEIKEATLAFKKYSKSETASKNGIKRGLKQLILIQENMESIGKLSIQIKSESKT